MMLYIRYPLSLRQVICHETVRYFKLNRSAALAEWRQLAACESSIVGSTGPIKLV